MNRQIKKILVILVLIVILPTLFFSIYEFNSLSSNEKIITNIYEAQLDMIIFSVNSTSEDIVSRWGNKFSSYVWDKTRNSKDADVNISTLLKQNRSIKYISFIPLQHPEKFSFYSEDSIYNSTSARNSILPFYKQSRSKIEKLQELKQKGYRKFEPVIDSRNPELTHFFFLSEYSEEPLLNEITVDSKQFISENLASKIIVAASNSFIITVFEQSTKKTVFSNDIDTKGNYSRSREIWLLPQYEIAIKLKGMTIEEIAKTRINENLVLLFILTVLLVSGAVIIIVNIKKEMKLAEIKSEFVSNVSHELRTPLALINMFAETLSMGRVRTEEKKEEYYQIISRETERLSNIVNKILNFSQIEAGKRKYNFSDNDLNEIIAKIYDNYQFHLKNKGFNFTCLYSESELLINCDPEAVAEAVINLIDNAVKYSADKKEITINTRVDSGLVLVEIKDSGIGISGDDQKRIYEKFFRVSTGLVHNTKGTGLGLAIVKHIIDAHQAKIELFSKLGEGSRFVLKFKKAEIKTSGE